MRPPSGSRTSPETQSSITHGAHEAGTLPRVEGTAWAEALGAIVGDQGPLPRAEKERGGREGSLVSVEENLRREEGGQVCAQKSISL